MANVLIIDDEELFRQMLSDVVRRMGHAVDHAANIAQGLEAVDKNGFDVVFLDVALPDGNGLTVLPQIKTSRSAPEVIIITGAGDRDGAELAIKNGAWDYIQKHASLGELKLTLTRALQHRQEKLTRQPTVALKLEGIVGSSPQILVCYDRLAQAALSEANVLITGPTGSGKELFARAIHRNSSRAQQNFVVVDCAALPETLVESALFGHEKGAFTSADRAHDGLIRQAHGGTLFLDEVGEMPAAVQRAFLRVLQERRFRPVGGGREIASDFRLVAATNRDLESMVRGGSFRQDLLFRLRAICIELPPLRDRIQDIKEIIRFHLHRLGERQGFGAKGFSPEFFQALQAYDWPGNVRELVNALECALAAAGPVPTLFPLHLPNHIRVCLARASISDQPQTLDLSPIDRPPSSILPKMQEVREKALNAVERQYLTALLSHTGGNMDLASRVSGLSKPRLYALFKHYDLTRTG